MSAYRLSVLVCCSLIFATFVRGIESQSQPYDSDFGRGYHNLFPNHSAPTGVSKLQDVDFGNQPMAVFKWHGKPWAEARLRDGFWEDRDEAGRESVTLESVHYLHALDFDREFALVIYDWFAAGGSSSSEGVAQLVSLANHQLTVSQQLDWDEHFYTKSPLESFDAKSQTLVIRSAHYLPGDAHCCVSAMDVITLHWNGTHFVQSAIETLPTQYAIENGKESAPAQSVSH